MSTIDVLKSNLSNIENNIKIYQEEITEITAKIKEIVDTLKDNTIPVDDSIWDTMVSYSLSDFSSLEKGLLSIQSIDVGDEIIDYSVTMSNLTLKETIDINGKKVNIYTSNKTDALYVISSGLNSGERKELNSELKNHLSNDQMAILTFNADCYRYDISNKSRCTFDYAVVGKTDKGKMFSFVTTKDSEIVVDDGHMGNNDTLITTINGFVLANKMATTMETDTEINLKVRPQLKIQGGQVITEFTRLSFSGGTSKSTGSQFATVYMEGDWQRYANTGENRRNGTWINDEMTRNVVTVGNGPTGNYAKRFHVVGHVDTYVVPVVIRSGNRVGSQTMQGTVCYHHEGGRAGYTSKDMLRFGQRVVADWSKL